MQTNISKVDESFVDFMAPGNVEDDGGLPKKNKNKQTTILLKQKSNFMLYFDISLFVAPPVIIKLEERLSKLSENDEKSPRYGNNIRA